MFCCYLDRHNSHIFPRLLPTVYSGLSTARLFENRFVVRCVADTPGADTPAQGRIFQWSTWAREERCNPLLSPLSLSLSRSRSRSLERLLSCIPIPPLRVSPFFPCRAIAQSRVFQPFDEPHHLALAASLSRAVIFIHHRTEKERRTAPQPF